MFCTSTHLPVSFLMKLIRPLAHLRTTTPQRTCWFSCNTTDLELEILQDSSDSAVPSNKQIKIYSAIQESVPIRDLLNSSIAING